MTTATLVGAGAWTADIAHTRVTFAARHLFGQTVRGGVGEDGPSTSGRTGAPSGSTRRSTPPRSIPATPAAMTTSAGGASSTPGCTR